MGFEQNPDVDPELEPGGPEALPGAEGDDNAEPAPAGEDQLQAELQRLREDNARLTGALSQRYGSDQDYGRREAPPQPSFDESIQELAGETGIPVERLRGAFNAHAREVGIGVAAEVYARVAADNFIRDFYQRFRKLNAHRQHVEMLTNAWLNDPRNRGRNLMAEPAAVLEIAKRAHADLRLPFRDYNEEGPGGVEVVPAGDVRRAHVAGGRPAASPAPRKKAQEEDHSDEASVAEWGKSIADRQTAARTPGRLAGVAAPR